MHSPQQQQRCNNNSSHARHFNVCTHEAHTHTRALRHLHFSHLHFWCVQRAQSHRESAIASAHVSVSAASSTASASDPASAAVAAAHYVCLPVSRPFWRALMHISICNCYFLLCAHACEGPEAFCCSLQLHIQKKGEYSLVVSSSSLDLKKYQSKGALLYFRNPCLRGFIEK